MMNDGTDVVSLAREGLMNDPTDILYIIPYQVHVPGTIKDD